VELALSRYNSSTSVPNHLSCEFTTEMRDPASSPSPPPEIQLTTTSERPSAQEGTPSNKVVVQSTQRPNHLRLPSHGSFSLSAATSTPPLSTPSSDAHGFMYHGNNAPRRVELRILVVDDDPLTRTLMTRMLTRMGHKVDTVENGELALEMITGEPRATPSTVVSTRTEPVLENGEVPRHPATEGKYAVVFLDNQMPVMTGLEAVAKLRGMGRRDFVVGITGTAVRVIMRLIF
jgi:osomolarity two-component system, sensor histidine kinase SLN1